MTDKIDCTGLQCPGPVLKTKKYLETCSPEQINVVVDNEAAAENINRFLNFQGFKVSTRPEGNNFIVSGTSSSDNIPNSAESKIAADSSEDNRKDRGRILVVISSVQMGTGDDELGRKLMINFVKTLREMGNDLWRLILLNHGVKLCTAKSQVLEDLKELDRSGVSILVCGTCLTHLDLMSEKAVGETTNMLDVVTSMQVAEKIIRV